MSKYFLLVLLLPALANASAGIWAFTQPIATLSPEQKLFFFTGQSFAQKPWVSSPATTTARDGLGPLFNSNTCQGCHIRNSKARVIDGIIATPVIKIQEDKSIHALGQQIQLMALPGYDAEARLEIDYHYEIVQFSDGSRIELRKPIPRLTDIHSGRPLNTKALSLRMAGHIPGIGYLAAIPDSVLESLEDIDDKDNNGISGKLNRVLDVDSNSHKTGRFGWKASQPTLTQQIAVALVEDMGITSRLFPTEPCPSNFQCKRSEGFEASNKVLSLLTDYVSNIALPTKSKGNEEGKSLFTQAGCSACHIPSLPVSKDNDLSLTSISPYTDLLLHDMGKGLADNLSEGLAQGSEWRTAPLWGLGQVNDISGSTAYLHDGRARNLMEAILWHGGEAESSKQAVLLLNKRERDALITFLESL